MGEYFTTQGAEGLELVRWARERDPQMAVGETEVAWTLFEKLLAF